MSAKAIERQSSAGTVSRSPLFWTDRAHRSNCPSNAESAIAASSRWQVRAISIASLFPAISNDIRDRASATCLRNASERSQLRLCWGEIQTRNRVA